MTEGAIDAARSLRASGLSWPKVSAAVGLSVHRLRCVLEPGYREKYNAYEAIARQRFKIVGFTHTVDGGRPDPKHVEEMLASIPADTRNFTARALGDPLPGRSALDKRVETTSAAKPRLAGVSVKFSTGGCGENLVDLLATHKRGVLMEDRHSNSEAVD